MMLQNGGVTIGQLDMSVYIAHINPSRRPVTLITGLYQNCARVNKYDLV